MNVRPGLLGLWMVFSSLWLALVFTIRHEEIISPHLEEKIYLMPNLNSGFFELYDYSLRYDDGFIRDHWSMEFPNNVKLYVLNGVPQDEAGRIGPDFYRTYSQPREKEIFKVRIRNVMTALGTGLIPPVMLLGLGVAGLRTVGGFGRRKPRKKT